MLPSGHIRLQLTISLPSIAFNLLPDFDTPATPNVVEITFRSLVVIQHVISSLFESGFIESITLYITPPVDPIQTSTTGHFILILTMKLEQR